MPEKTAPHGAQPKQHFWHERPWKWLVSLHVGVVLLTLVAIISIGATLIPEKQITVQTPAGPQEQTLDALARAQQLVYYTWWFQTLLLALALNVGCSTVRIVWEKILPARRAGFRHSPAFYRHRTPSCALRYGGDAAEVARALGRRGFRTATEGASGYAWRGTLGRWGAPIAHTGIVIVLLSGFASKWVAREGFVTVLEGEGSNFMVVREGGQSERVDLGFTIQCDDFETGVFPKTQTPSKFISTVTSADAEPPLWAERVEVNRSVVASGWVLHQTNYQKAEGVRRFLLEMGRADLPSSLTLELTPGQRRFVPGAPKETYISLGSQYPYEWRVESSDGEVIAGKASVGEVELSSGVLFTLSGALAMRAERFEPDLMVGEGGIASRSQELNNPALNIALYRGNEPVASNWIFGKEELKQAMHGMQGEYQFDLVSVTGETPNWRFEVEVRHDSSSEPLGRYTLEMGKIVPLNVAQAQTANAEKSGPWSVKRVGDVDAYATTLTLTRNPAVPFVYFGCALMMLGLTVAFLGRRRQIWFTLQEGAEKRLCVAAEYKYASEAFDKDTLAALEALCPGQDIVEIPTTPKKA